MLQMEVVPVRTTHATSALKLTATASPSRSRRNQSKKSSTSTTAPSRRNPRRSPAMKVEMPSTATTSTATDDGDGDSDNGDGYGPPHVDNYRYCGSPAEDPEPKVIDVYHHPLNEGPESELGDSDGDAVDVNDNYDCDPPEEEPGLVATGDDTEDDVGYDCSHCGISLGTRKFKVAHELRCKVQRQRREFESKLTKLYHCGYCRCPFVNEELKEQHQRRGCRKRPAAKKKPSNGPYFGCDKCEYVTKWECSLETHFLTHNKNNAEWFTCTQCSYKTVCKSNMTRHMKIHGNAFSCCCSICGKSFQRKTHLDNHLLKRHSDESDEVSKLITSKVYTCNICDKYRTVIKANFNIHLTVFHLKGVGCQKYECPRCPYSTFRKYHLTTHSKTHSKQKDYRCAVCKKQFVQKMQLDSHILCNHAGNADLMKTITMKIYRCESCSFKSLSKNRLEIHVQSKHS